MRKEGAPDGVRRRDQATTPAPIAIEAPISATGLEQPHRPEQLQQDGQQRQPDHGLHEPGGRPLPPGQPAAPQVDGGQPDGDGDGDQAGDAGQVLAEAQGLGGGAWARMQPRGSSSPVSS